MEKGLVSCIIPTYKRCDMLPRAIESVLNQTYKNIEILVVDDNEPGSIESKEVQILLSNNYNFNQIRYVGQKKHINGAVARNVGIEEANGEFIAFLDDDEEWLPDKIQLQMVFLNNHRDVSGVACLYSDYLNNKEVARIIKYSTDNLQLQVLCGRVLIHTSTFICTKESIVKSGCFDPTLTRHQDVQLFVDFLNYSNIGLVDKYLVKNHIDSEINRPNSKKLIKVKNDFFNSVKATIDKYDKLTQHRIKKMHNYEIAYISLKEKNIKEFLKYFFKDGISILAIFDLIARSKFKVKISEKKYDN